MIIRNINLETVCGITSKLPENDKPEIAFAGKSNVGEIFVDQCADEPQILCKNFSHTRKDADN